MPYLIDVCRPGLLFLRSDKKKREQDKMKCIFHRSAFLIVTKMLPRIGSIMKRSLLIALSDPVNLERPHAMDLHNIAFRYSGYRIQERRQHVSRSHVGTLYRRHPVWWRTSSPGPIHHQCCRGGRCAGVAEDGGRRTRGLG